LENEANPIVYIPNVFSPNGDGINDFFTIYGNKDVEQVLEMRIFDRWGNFVYANNRFPPNEENYGWDGAFKNIAMNPAVFAYWAHVQFTDGSVAFYKGDVTLVR
jgi:gliding motility-associated-like protein